MKVIKLGRREGKTTKALEFFRQEDQAALIVTSNNRRELIKELCESKEISRIFTSFDVEKYMKGRIWKVAIIDDADNIPLSRLLEIIFFFEAINCEIIITTSV